MSLLKPMFFIQKYGFAKDILNTNIKNIKTVIHSLKVMIWEGQKAAEGQPRPGGPEIYSFGPQPEFRL